MVVFVLGWLLVATIDYFAMSLTWVFPFPFVMITGGAWLFGVLATAISAALLWRRLRWFGLAGCAVVTAAVVMLIAGTDWVHFYARTWYTIHRSDFAAALRKADTGHPDAYPSMWRLNSGDGHPVWLVVAWAGIPDCAVGFAHFSGDPEKYFPDRPIDSLDYLDGMGCAVHPTVNLGDGWWWVE